MQVRPPEDIVIRALTGYSTRHPWKVIARWAVLGVVLSALAPTLIGRVTQNQTGDFLPKSYDSAAALEKSCPIRFRCVGCDHFRTDVSYLPDLQAYLADLLRSRERLMSAFAADDWARSEAMPSQEEIRRVRRLIERVEADLDDLTVEEQAQIGEAASPSYAAAGA
ncbi:hypothetical protein [Streptomyces sp. NPDC059970]|uniref:hypothetical protein n=1 Tax=Streptomyces sp. NPDC059970 TaxID=3347019 RepID=UPI00367DBDC5